MSELAFLLVPPQLDGEGMWLFLLVGSVAAGLCTMGKAGFGGGLSLLSTPLMVHACGGNSKLALGIMLPMLVVSDYIILAKWWGKWDAKAALTLAPGAFVGLGLGWVTLYYLQRYAQTGGERTTNAIMMLAIGAIAVGFSALHAWRSRRREPIHFRPVFWQATSVGTVAGYTSTMAHAAGPVITMYLLPQGMTKMRFVATTSLYYWYGNQIKLVPYFCLGMIDVQTLGANVALLPSVVVGAAVGVYLHHKVGEKHFSGVVNVLLFLAGLDLAIRAARTLWF